MGDAGLDVGPFIVAEIVMALAKPNLSDCQWSAAEERVGISRTAPPLLDPRFELPLPRKKSAG
jgi:hypothetical protein